MFTFLSHLIFGMCVNFGIRYLAFVFFCIYFLAYIVCFKKHFVSISMVTFWHLYSPHAFNSLSSANYFNVYCHVTLKNHISGVTYNSISSYTSLEREKNTLSKKKYFGRRKPIIFRHKKIKKHILHKNFLKFLKTVI